VCLLEEYEKSKATNAINDWRAFNFGLIREFSLLDLNVRIDSIEENDCFKEVSNLEILNLEGENITRFRTNSFQHLGKLKKLNLGFNQIDELGSNVFRGLENLEELNLECNQLNQIQSFEHLERLRVLNLGTNRIGIDSSLFIGLVNLEELWSESN
jgi:Leucine-rich repeat (LRR) protein